MKGECDVCGRDGVPLQWAADGTEDLLCEQCAAFFNDPERQAEKALDAELAALELLNERLSLLRLLDRRELQLRKRAVLQRLARAKLKEHLASPSGLLWGLGLLGFGAFQLVEEEPEPDPKTLN